MSNRFAPHEVVLRAYDERRDRTRADALDRACEAGPSGNGSLHTDLLGDPLCRIRHYPAYHMLVAELEGEMVGLIRAGVKEVVIRAHQTAPTAYILGLRVSPPHRRLGIGARLVLRMEEWCKAQGAQYVYIATEKDNEASVALFTTKLGYVKFRSPAILVQPIHSSTKKLSPKIHVAHLHTHEALSLYTSIFHSFEFFPLDIHSILASPLHKGTWVATWKTHHHHHRLAPDPLSPFAVMSLWKCNDIFRLQVKGAPLRVRTLAAASRALATLFPWPSTIPTIPNVFKPFGLQLMYGLHAHGGPASEPLVHHLCSLAHNLAKQDGCAVVAVELGACDPLCHVIPHWKSLSCDEDLLCIKSLSSHPNEEGESWCKLPPSPSLFVDPRDF